MMTTITRAGLGFTLLGSLAVGCLGYGDVDDVPLPPIGVPTPPSTGDDPPEPEPEPTERCDAPTLVLQASCAGAACHDPGSPFGGFADPETVEELVGVAGAAGPSCLYVNPEEPLESLILTRAVGGSECGPPSMPLGRPPLTDDEVACLEDWLLQFED